jgi:hypothetical protein
MHADHVLYLQRKMTDMGIAAHMEHMSEGRDREERSRPIFMSGCGWSVLPAEAHLTDFRQQLSQTGLMYAQICKMG